MITIETVVYIVIVIMGAIIVAVAAFLIIKTTSKKDIARTQKQPVDPPDNIETSTAPRKRRAPTFGLALNKLKFLLGLSLSRFNRQKRNVTTDQPSINEGQAINKQFSIPLPGVTSSKPEVNTMPSSPVQGVPKAEPANEEEPEINTMPSSPVQGVPKAEPANEEEPEVNTLDTFPAESAESTQEQLQEELEPVEQEPEQIGEASDDTDPEQSKSKGTAFDLFTEEIVEESDTGKLAAALNNVDVHDLLEEAQTLMNQLGGGRG